MKLDHVLLAVCALAPLAGAAPLRSLACASAEDKSFREIGYEAARKAAQEEEKVLLIAFVDDKNPEARKLDATWRDGKVREWIDAQAVAIAVDVKKARTLADTFRVYHVPTIVFVSPAGLELDRVRGFRDAKQFLEDAVSVSSGKDAETRTKERLAGHERDPWLRLDHASALHDQGVLREALEHYLYCWDHGIEVDPAFAAARDGTLLPAMLRLAVVYPATVDAVIERIEALGQKINVSVASEAEVAQFIELASRFQRHDLILQLHDALRQKGESTAAIRKRLAPFLIEILMEEKRYDEALVSLGDAEKDLEKKIEEFEALRLKDGEPAQGDERDPALDAARFRVTRFAVDCFEAALATKQPDLGRKLAERALVFDRRVGTYSELIRRARRAGETGIAIVLVRRALDGDLSQEEKIKLRDSTVAFPRLK